jgi:hypothetical protein
VPEYADMLMGPNHVFTFETATYGATWYHWTTPDAVAELEDDTSEDELSDFDKAYDALAAKYNEERKKHEEAVLKEKIAYIGDGKPAQLMQQAVLHGLRAKLHSPERVGVLLGIPKATA